MDLYSQEDKKYPIYIELNVALDRTALASATLWYYRPSFAVDGNADTCAMTPRTADQRWWQVDLGLKRKVGSVALVINKDSYHEFTIFVIELLSKSEALYKPCATFKGRFQAPRTLFTCNDGRGHEGRYVYVRDDRRDQDYFSLCEVEVFGQREAVTCGEPELPVAAQVAVTGDASSQTAIYSCDAGYKLLAEPNRTCEADGRWTGHAPQCQVVVCTRPGILRYGWTEVEEDNRTRNGSREGAYSGRPRVGALLRYRCRPGYVLWGNVTRTCSEFGRWTGTSPQCKPITCGQPTNIAHAKVQLINGSTLWNHVAKYSCQAGYAMPGGVSHLSITCLSSGLWEPVNVTCQGDGGDRNLPVKLTFSEKEHDSLGPGGAPHSSISSSENGPAVLEWLKLTAGFLASGVLGILLIICLGTLGIVLARRMRAQKSAANQQNGSELRTIDGTSKSCVYDDTTENGGGVATVVTVDTEPNRYDPLDSFPTVSSYASSLMPTDPLGQQSISAGAGYATLGRRVHMGTPPVAATIEPHYETLRHLQQLSMEPAAAAYEMVLANGQALLPMTSTPSATRAATLPRQGRPTRRVAVPSVFKMLAPSKLTGGVVESSAGLEAGKGPTPPLAPTQPETEILAIYAQVDKTKKRKPREEEPIATVPGVLEGIGIGGEACECVSANYWNKGPTSTSNEVAETHVRYVRVPPVMTTTSQPIIDPNQCEQL